MKSSHITKLSPADGSIITPGDRLSIQLPGLKIYQVKLGGKTVTFKQKGNIVSGLLPKVRSTLGYLPLEIRAKDKAGKRVYRQLLYLDKKTQN